MHKTQTRYPKGQNGRLTTTELTSSLPPSSSPAAFIQIRILVFLQRGCHLVSCLGTVMDAVELAKVVKVACVKNGIYWKDQKDDINGVTIPGLHSGNRACFEDSHAILP